MINKHILVGRVGKQPEVRYLSSGSAIANFSLATTEKWTNKQTGEREEKTEWSNIVVFGKLAEVVERYVNKGDLLYIEGKVVTRKWQDKNTGQDRYTTETVLDFNGVMQMLGGKREDAGGQQAHQPQQEHQPQPQQTYQQQNQNFQQPPAYQANDFDNDVPF